VAPESRAGASRRDARRCRAGARRSRHSTPALRLEKHDVSVRAWVPSKQSGPPPAHDTPVTSIAVSGVISFGYAWELKRRKVKETLKMCHQDQRHHNARRNFVMLLPLWLALAANVLVVIVCLHFFWIPTGSRVRDMGTAWFVCNLAILSFGIVPMAIYYMVKQHRFIVHIAAIVLALSPLPLCWVLFALAKYLNNISLAP